MNWELINLEKEYNWNFWIFIKANHILQYKHINTLFV